MQGETGKSISVAIDLLNRSVIARLPDESSLEAIREIQIESICLLLFIYEFLKL